MLTLSGLSIILGYFSWKFIEKYFRDRQKNSQKKIFIYSFIGLCAFTLLGLFGHYKNDLAYVGLFNPYQKIHRLTDKAYFPDNKVLQTGSWLLLRKLSKDKNYKTINNKFDNELWFDPAATSKRLLLIGNSHSKDIYNIVSQNELFLKKFQVARYGLQINHLNVDHKLWASPNYLSATHILIASRYSDEDVDVISMNIAKMLSDGKKVSIASNIFEFPGKASGYSLIDEIVLKNINQITTNNLAKIANLVNKQYFNYYQTTQTNHSNNVNLRISKIAKLHKIPFINRMDYICEETVEMCYAVDDNLSKNFYDYGHHTLSGALYFARSDLFPNFLNNLDGLNIYK